MPEFPVSPEPDLKLRATDPLKLPLGRNDGITPVAGEDGEVLVLPSTASIYCIRGNKTGSFIKVRHTSYGNGVQDSESFFVKLSPDEVVAAIRAHRRQLYEVDRHNKAVIEEARRLARVERLKNVAKDVVDADFGEDEDMLEEAMRGPRRRPARARRDEVRTVHRLDEGDVMLEMRAEDW